MEDMILDKVGAKEAELHAAYDERLRNYDERCVLALERDCRLIAKTLVSRAGRGICNDKSRSRAPS